MNGAETEKQLPYSRTLREVIRENLRTNQFDVVIIGGGITGAGIALDAASRGLKTALVEKEDFASGTSSRSTKLIHGGLRYLRQFQFHIVAETGRERKRVHRLAPHLVIPEKMVLPVMKGAPEGKLLVSFGLWLYDLLAGVKGEDRKKMLNRHQTIEKEPLLASDRLKAGGYYAEYMTDDARLTIEVIKTAAKQGASCLNYVAAKEFLYSNGRISGIRCHDIMSGDDFDVSGSFVVNATGPWVDELRKKNGSLTKKHLFITKGIHLVFKREKLPVNHALYFEIPDGRMIFLIPRGDKTYVGTTDTPYSGDKDHIVADTEDAEYLLEALKYLFPSLDIGFGDILSSWAGIRPLIYEEGKSASEISRKDEIFISPTGLISMAGGKLTGYRKMAQKVVNIIIRKMEPRERKHISRSRTKSIPLTASGFSGYGEVQAYEKALREQLPEWQLPEKYANALTLNYGRQADDILKRMASIHEEDPEKRLILAELDFCLEYEMVIKPLDFLERRSSRLYFMVDTVKKYYPGVLEKFRTVFNWDEKTFQEEKKVVESRIRAVSEIKPG
ncbi:MAG: glycerol-3-phosphate dehydrogenase/oxidase [Chlorobi bacterium]|nr:glycerol-3-phosphate dehydrogenase/oxidase [Chlorobiota bacterium]